MDETWFIEKINYTQKTQQKKKGEGRDQETSRTPKNKVEVVPRRSGTVQPPHRLFIESWCRRRRTVPPQVQAAGTEDLGAVLSEESFG